MDCYVGEATSEEPAQLFSNTSVAGQEEPSLHQSNGGEIDPSSEQTYQNPVPVGRIIRVVKLNSPMNFSIAENVVVESIDMSKKKIVKLVKNKKPKSTKPFLISEGASVSGEDKKKNNKDKTNAEKKAHDSCNSNNPLEDWQEVEKQKLLFLMKNFGVNNMEKIASMMPEKSLADIKAVDCYFRKEAQQKLDCTAHEFSMRRRNKKARKTHEGNPLTEWQRKLNQIFSTEELHTVVSDALRLIADCEEIPAHNKTGNVDFKELYLLIADAMDGLPLSELSDESYEVLRHALTEISLTVEFLGKKGFNHHIKNLGDRPYPLMQLLSTDDDKKCPLKMRMVQLLKNKGYNPLAIPMSLLDIDAVKARSAMNVSVEIEDNQYT